MKTIFTSILSFLALYSKGQTWQQLTIPTTQDIVSSSFISDDEGWIGTENSGSSAIIYHTSDGGTTWNSDTITGASGGSCYIEFVTSQIGYAVVDGEAFKTEDSGNTWFQLALPDIPYYTPYFLNEDTGFVSGSYNKINKTLDGGLTWMTYPSYYSYPFYSMDFINDSVGAGCEYDQWLYGTSDGGVTWEWLDSGSLFEWFFAVSYKPDGSIYYTGYEDFIGQITYLIKGPNGYSDEYLDELYDIKWFDNLRCYAVGASGYVVYTLNEGYDWNKLKLPALFGLPNKTLLQVNGFNDVYVFGENGYAFKLPNSCIVVSSFDANVDFLNVQFTDQSPDADAWYWNFGDGTTDTTQNPLHTYSIAGEYEVCLTASSDSCGSSTLCFDVIVCEPNTSLSWIGTLDSTFAEDGVLIDEPIGDYELAYTLRIQQDGKILACDRGHWANIVRYNSDGSRDSSFSDDGIITETDTDFEYTAQNRLALASDGKIALTLLYNMDVITLRYNSDGSTDSSFGTNGTVITDLSQTHQQDHFVSSAFQPDGKLLVFGVAYPQKANVARFNPDGSLDSTFANDGIFNSQNLIGYNNGFWGDIVIQNDGKIMIGGSNDGTTSYYYLLRLNANGTVDSLFGVNGIVKTYFGSGIYTLNFLYSILIQSDGKYLAAGTGSNYWSSEHHYHYAIARFNSDGTPDSSFGSNGIDSFRLGSLESYGTDAELQDDGKIIFTGYYGFPDEARFKIGLLRLNSNGTLDSTFGNYGFVTTTEDCGNTVSYSIALDDDKIYVGGANPAEHFLVARYNNGCNMVISDYTYLPSGLQAQFTDQSSAATSWLWDFSDGNTSTLQNPSHTYSSEGTYNVCLTITDSCGNNTYCEDVTVCDQLNIDFLYQQNGLSVQMLNQITEASSFFWDFGDGTTSTDQNPVHDFPSAGTYHVCLIEWDECASDTICKDINIIATGTGAFSIQQSAFSIHPNPFTDQITVELEPDQPGEVYFHLTDLTGKIIRSFSARNKSAGIRKKELDLEGIAAGVYVLQINSNGILHRMKIVKQ